MVMIELKRLNAFVTVVEAGSITRAAELLFIQQPVLRQNINPVKYYQHGRDAEPMGMKRVFNIAMKKVDDGMPQSAAGAPGYAHEL